MDALISVIVPVYNISGYLRKSIESIFRQTYQNLEVIAVDDGSSDDSLDILKELASEDRRLHVLHQNNQGVTSARLAGISFANGEWIGFVDGDDVIEEDMYERLVKNAFYYKADISHCGYQMVFPSRVEYYYNTGSIQVHNRQEALKELLGGKMEPGLVNKMYKKHIFDKAMLEKKMDQKIRINEDLLMNYYLFSEAEKSVFEDVCPYHYQVRKGSAATSSIKPYKLQDPIKVSQILVEETKGDAELYTICMSNLASKLTRVSVKLYKNSDTKMSDCINDARRQLKLILPELRGISGIPMRIRILAEWAAASPETYRIIHKLYGRMTGKTHKYDVK